MDVEDRCYTSYVHVFFALPPLITYIFDHNKDHGLIHDLLGSFLIDRQNTTLKLLPEIVSFHHCNLRSCNVY